MKALVKSEGQFVIEHLNEKVNLEKNVKQLSRALAEAKDALKMVVNEKNAIIASRDVEISQLKKQINEISGFKKVKG